MGFTYIQTTRREKFGVRIVTVMTSSLTLSNSQLDFKVNRRWDNRFGEDKDILQTNYHHKVREDFP